MVGDRRRREVTVSYCPCCKEPCGSGKRIKTFLGSTDTYAYLCPPCYEAMTKVPGQITTSDLKRASKILTFLHGAN